MGSEQLEQAQKLARAWRPKSRPRADVASPSSHSLCAAGPIGRSNQ
jgi:hypothetical protein